MTELFKELNIIDILGIGVPGCLLVLLLGGDQTAALLWADQFQGNVLAFAVLLLVAGSLAGMLTQELGDLIEKGLWLIPWLDPKIHAAHSVNRKDLKLNDIRKHAYAEPKGAAPVLTMIFCVLGALAVVWCATGLLPTALLRSVPGANADAWADGSVLAALWPLPIAAVAVALFCRKLPSRKEAEWANLKTIRNANPYIQTRLVGHGNTSKRTLFDGWRFVMRNLIIVLAVINLVSLWKPVDLYRQIAQLLTASGGDGTDHLFRLTLITACAVCLMLVRYYHYAYLRYKYSLENFMRLDDEKARKKAEATAAK